MPGLQERVTKGNALQTWKSPPMMTETEKLSALSCRKAFWEDGFMETGFRKGLLGPLCQAHCFALEKPQPPPLWRLCSRPPSAKASPTPVAKTLVISQGGVVLGRCLLGSWLALLFMFAAHIPLHSLLHLHSRSAQS